MTKADTPLIHGVYTALITPFLPQGGLDREALKRLIERQIRAGIRGIVFGGSTGEGQALTIEEIDELISTALPFQERIQIIGACGQSSTAETANRYRRLSQLGVNAVLVSTPAYNKPPQRGLIAHFETVAAAAATPIILYNIPGRTAVNLLPETLQNLWKIPHLVSVKESSGSLEQMQQILRQIPKGKTLLSGDDPLHIPVWALGGQGCVSVLSNLAPEAIQKLWTLWTQGSHLEAGALQIELSRIIQLLFTESNPIPCKFAVGALLEKEWSPRLPLVPLDPSLRPALLQEIVRLREKGLCSA